MPKRRTGGFVDSLNSCALSLANSPILQQINENIFFFSARKTDVKCHAKLFLKCTSTHSRPSCRMLS